VKTRQRNGFLSVRTEGALLPADLLERLVAPGATKDIPGLEPESYHLPPRERIAEATNRAWNACRAAWAAFRRATDALPEGDPGTTPTRERWLLPLFNELGYGRLLPARGGIQIDDKAYPISHSWHRSPIHLVGCNVGLDGRSPGVRGAAGASPHSLVQELLNRSDDHLWGIVANGRVLRLLRDNASLTRQAYVEFDLQAMMDGELYADFVLLWLLCHQSRVEAERPGECWLERWSQEGQREGVRLRDRLQEGVVRAIGHLGSGFLAHRANGALREALYAGNLDKQDYYRELLRLVYRLLFLFVAEDRGLLLDPHGDPEARARYTAYYGTARLRGLAGQRVGTLHHDLYQVLRLVMDGLGGDDGCPGLALPALGSFLFSARAIPHLGGCEIANVELLGAIRALAFTVDEGVRLPVDYRNLGAEELGSIYESLLELHPALDLTTHAFSLERAAGNERKTTGSYYTPTPLITSLLETALDPVLDEAARSRDPEAAILALRICDPAAGSGHFVLAAARRIARRLAAARTGDEEPSPAAMRTALRDVIGRCIYAVDVNPMAVELCKVSLWLEALEPGKPLSFLDSHIRCGNALLGATPRLLDGGIPDSAFTPIEGDDRAYCAEWKKRNAKERTGQLAMHFDRNAPWDQLGRLFEAMHNLEILPDGSIEAVHRKEEAYAELVRSAPYHVVRLRADAWCAAFVWRKRGERIDPRTGAIQHFDYPITDGVYRDIEYSPHTIAGWMGDEIARLADQGNYNFLHWHLAFPEVFRLPRRGERAENAATGWSGGFDVVLGNPPWDRIKLQEKEWFSAHGRQDIADAANAARRQRMIAALVERGDPSGPAPLAYDPALHAAFQEGKRRAEGESHLVRNSGRFPLTAVGDVNTYALFAETFRTITSTSGRAGLICPTGIATDDSTKRFFGDLSDRRALVSLYDFENRKGIFPAVDSRYKFVLLTASGAPVPAADLAFFCTDPADLEQPERRFSLSPEDIALLNPNTRTCPIFRTRADADLTRAIYRRVPVLVDEATGANPWGVKFQAMFHMSNDSGLFRDAPAADLVPLYEAKLLHQYDHRWATYDGGDARDLTDAEKADPSWTVIPRYWVPRAEVESRLVGRWDRGWLLGFRDIARNTDERTAIFSLMPRVGVGHTMPLFMGSELDARSVTLLLGNMGSLALDYTARQKVGGTHLTYGYLKQLSVLPPAAYTPADLAYIVPRVLELVYTAWDLQPFARDLGYDGDPFPFDRQVPDPRAAAPGCTVSRRALLRAELDAYYAQLYGLSRKQLRYILDPHSLTDRELSDILDPAEDPPDAPRTRDFPGETFRVLKDREMREYGEYRTGRLVLAAWDALGAWGPARSGGSGERGPATAVAW